MVVLLSIYTLLTSGYGIKGTLTVYNEPVLRIFQASKPALISDSESSKCNPSEFTDSESKLSTHSQKRYLNDDLQGKSSSKRSRQNKLGLQLGEKNKKESEYKNSNFSESESENNRVKIGSDSEEETEADGSAISADESDPFEDDDSMISDLSTDRNKDPSSNDFIVDFECKLAESKHSKFAANLEWCGVSIAILNPESKPANDHLNLVQVSWELKDEQSASIVFSVLNGILQ
ncbi:hypothetical protein BB560_001859 [Smittium megazygosporum]|nr:hypothetical protein BB560_001859 [Smittium megazygosporum]